MVQTIYVDSQNGSDTNTGKINYPVQTLSYAYNNVYEGGVIVLQQGDSTSYGGLTVNKNISILAAYGTSPKIGKIDVSEAQCFLQGLTFNNLTEGIVVNNSAYGAVHVKQCRFDVVETAIDIQSVQYISIHRNYFVDHKYGVLINSAEEVCASSNVFEGGARSFDVTTVNRLDLWHNTLYGSSSIATGITPDTNLRVIYLTLTPFDIAQKRVQLPTFAVQSSAGHYDVAMNVVNGPSFNYYEDYIVEAFGSIVSWDGLRLESEFQAGDMIRIMYSEDEDPGSGDAIRVLNVGDTNSRVDSSSITGKISDIGIGVFINTPLKIRHNNFYKTTEWWSGATPTGDTGLKNIDEDPLYRDPLNSDFRLSWNGVSGTSPNIDAADPGRWTDVYNELGVINIDGKYTGSVTGIRRNVAPFNRDIDYLGYHRGITGIHGVTGDIGAYEFDFHETAMGNYVDERGYDYGHPGSETAPYSSIDRGYVRAGAQDLNVSTRFVPYEISPTGPVSVPTDGYRYGRYRSNNMVLSASDLNVGDRNSKDIVYIYSSYPSFETGAVFVSPDGSDGYTGTIDSPYRTITRALQDGVPHVFVKPGFYPSFQGVTGIKLIGFEEDRDIPFDNELYNNFLVGSYTGIGSYSKSRKVLSFIDATEIRGGFSFDIDIDLKYLVTARHLFMVGIDNGSNSAFVTFDYDTGKMKIGFYTDSNTYEYNYDFSSGFTDAVFTDVVVRFNMSGNKVRTSVRNSHINESMQFEMGSGYADPWWLFFESSGTGTSSAEGIQLQADLFYGVTGILSTMTRKRVFGIMGVTGPQI